MQNTLNAYGLCANLRVTMQYSEYFNQTFSWFKIQKKNASRQGMLYQQAHQGRKILTYSVALSFQVKIELEYAKFVVTALLTGIVKHEMTCILHCSIKGV